MDKVRKPSNSVCCHLFSFVGCLTTLWVRYGDMCGDELEGCARGLIQVLTRNLPGGTEETLQKPRHDSQYPETVSKIRNLERYLRTNRSLSVTRRKKQASSRVFGDTGFKSRPRDRPPGLGLLCDSLRPSIKTTGKYIKLRQDSLRQYSFQFIIHLSAYHSMLCDLSLGQLVKP
jgi:hypothetical protein